jgi:hypothetical protein
MHIWGYIKITWSHKSGVGCGAALVVNRAAIDNHDGKLAPVYFRPLHHSFCLCASCRQSAPQLFVHRTRRLALAAWEARMAALCRMHCTVTFGETSQPSSLPLTLSSLHPILSLRVWNIFFLVQLFCLSASRAAPHSCTASGPAVLPLRAKRATARCNWPAASDYVQSRAESSALEASCREGRTSSPELPMRWTDSMVVSIGLPEASGGMRCTGRFRSRGVIEAPPAPAPGFVGCTSRKSPPLPKSRASSGCPKGKVPESHTQL